MSALCLLEPSKQEATTAEVTVSCKLLNFPFVPQAVAVQGAHKGYHLQAADLTCSAMSELSVYNVRRLFANRGYEAMDLRHQFVGKKPTSTRWAKIANAVMDP